MLSRLRRRPGDAGFTLAEMTVVLALLSIVGLIAFRGLVSAYRTTTYVQNEVDASTELQRTVERIAREIRVADPLEAGVTGSQLQLRVIREGVCSRHYYRVVSGQLVQYTQTPLTPAPAPIGSPTLPNRCTTAATAVSGLPMTVHVAGLTSGTQVFRFFDAAGTELTLPSAGATIDLIAQVQVTLRRAAGNGRLVSVSTRVDIRNKVEAPL